MTADQIRQLAYTMTANMRLQAACAKGSPLEIAKAAADLARAEARYNAERSNSTQAASLSTSQATKTITIDGPCNVNSGDELSEFISDLNIAGIKVRR